MDFRLQMLALEMLEKEYPHAQTAAEEPPPQAHALFHRGFLSAHGSAPSFSPSSALNATEPSPLARPPPALHSTPGSGGIGGPAGPHSTPILLVAHAMPASEPRASAPRSPAAVGQAQPVNHTQADEPTKCRVCARRWATKYHARKHFMRVHYTGPKHYRCHRCGIKEYAMQEDLTTHLNSCGREFPCSCGLLLRSRQTLMRHCRKKDHAPPPLGVLPPATPLASAHARHATQATPLPARPPAPTSAQVGGGRQPRTHPHDLLQPAEWAGGGLGGSEPSAHRPALQLAGPSSASPLNDDTFLPAVQCEAILDGMSAAVDMLLLRTMPPMRRFGDAAAITVRHS